MMRGGIPSGRQAEGKGEDDAFRGQGKTFALAKVVGDRYDRHVRSHLCCTICCKQIGFVEGALSPRQLFKQYQAASNGCRDVRGFFRRQMSHGFSPSNTCGKYATTEQRRNNGQNPRSEERRVGKECRSRWS